MFAGPNGSGKSTLIHEIDKVYNLGYMINADVIKKQLGNQRYINCRDFYPTDLHQADFLSFINKYKEDERNKSFLEKKLFIENNILVCQETINSYEAALVATFFREELLKNKVTFSFETVMSHPSKIAFLKAAKQEGFKTYFYFICTQDPEINKGRVLNRVEKGGHDVDASKIESRYYRSLNLLSEAFKIADRVFILDSSNQKRNVILEKNKNSILFHEEIIPEWIYTYLLDKLDIDTE